MKRLQLLLHIIIIPIFLIELYSRWSGDINLEYFSKPFLMVWVLVYFLIFSGNSKSRTSIIFAFIFSWVGDMFLMLANTNEMLFYAGVGGFFVAQLFYIYTFLAVSGDKSVMGFVIKRPYWIIPFALYLGVILWLLFPGMDGIMIPIIIVYAISLIGMSLAALNRRYRVTDAGYMLVFIGSLFFVLSDSMIAINKFAFEFQRSSFVIMLTYFVAQYLIMRGLLKEWGSNKL